MAEEKSGGNQSLIRGLRLMDILSNFPNGCPLAKLAEISELNKSTVHRLLQGLQNEGYVKAASSVGSYRLTTKCLSLGQKTLASMNIIHLASSHLERLNLALGETVNFSKREDDHAIMIYKLEPTMGMMKTRAYIGQHLPLYCSAMGKLYLAYEENKEYLDRYWQAHSGQIEQRTCKTITDIQAMRQELNDILKSGFAMDREENELGVCCLAVPVFNHLGRVEYAISVSTSIHRLNEYTMGDFLREVQQTAQAISQELGWKEI
ncbi:IclR family transcriptional regulator [Glaesserella parasuis]|uniref:IclR family transcriptional regulator n=1 Tax=Glaesserella parasuis TaxID=738 RepID=UPI0004E840C3|nr:IclR family transcriptional regulator [Glaesserella parasuis]AIK18154.1 transcriptional regulator [Glaesserella parasuis]MDG6246291.1 IclR family transcriptional regulator [Glaesserella parasuis]MDG6329136.1 IclR family transcriptional regulator [Glaesserella parasuis]MDG6346236.1 IclR family transcriptional regulator [Glaesserella parasuis]MDG6405735.1 IclR family transcriptional regulator [Glaesserella parasuis]